MTLIFYLKHTLTFVIILQPSDVNFNHFQLHAQKLTLKFLARFHKNCTHVSEGIDPTGHYDAKGGGGLRV